MAPRSWPAPRTFGLLGDGQGIMFTCNGCGRHRAVDRHTLQRKWGTEGRPHELGARMRCQCGQRGARVERCKVEADNPTTEGMRAGLKSNPWDKLMREIDRLRPSGSVD